MTSSLTTTIDESTLSAAQRSMLDDFDRIKSAVQGAMAERFFEIVRLNFGDFGVDRPIDWAPLSDRYAKKVKRDHATLFVSGHLASGVKMESTDDMSRVFISKDDVPYALAHQYGNEKGHLPARPFFPVDGNGAVTPFTRAEVEQAAADEFARLITPNF